MQDGFGIFAVHVKDGYHQHFGDIGRVSGGTCIFGKRSITDLIVDDYMNRAAGFVSFQLGHIQGFSNDALPGKGSITMD